MSDAKRYLVKKDELIEDGFPRDAKTTVHPDYVFVTLDDDHLAAMEALQKRVRELEAGMGAIILIGLANPDCNHSGEYIESRNVARAILGKEPK